MYAVLSLTLVRMVPVALAMIGSHAPPADESAFLGWFGPRGLASIVFAVIVIEESRLPNVAPAQRSRSISRSGSRSFAHGSTAAPLADRYGRWFARHPREKRPPMEGAPAEVSRARLDFLGVFFFFGGVFFFKKKIIAGAVACAITAALTVSGSTSDYAWLEGTARALSVAAPIGAGLYAMSRPPFERFGAFFILTAFGFIWFVASLSNADDELNYSIGRVAGWAGEVVLIYLLLSFPGHWSAVKNRIDRGLANDLSSCWSWCSTRRRH